MLYFLDMQSKTKKRMNNFVSIKNNKIMNYKIGDKVKFLDEIGGGIIVEIVDANMVMVEGGDGFPVPCMITQLIPEGGFEESFRKDEDAELEIELENELEATDHKVEVDNEVEAIEQEIQADKEVSKDEDLPGKGRGEKEEQPGVYFALVPQESEMGLITNMYLINISTYHILFQLGKEMPDGMKNLDKDDLAPGEKVHLGYLPDWMENESMKIKYQILFFRKGTYTYKDPDVGILTLSQEKLDNPGSYIENSFFTEKALLLIISQESSGKKPAVHRYLEKPENTSLGVKKKSPQKPEKSMAEEVDLHIENIVDDYKDLSNREILKIQMDRFEVSLEGAIRNRQKRIIYIHGTGAGKLKYQIRKTLDDKYKRLKYQDASFMEFGYGATLVLLK